MAVAGVTIDGAVQITAREGGVPAGTPINGGIATTNDGAMYVTGDAVVRQSNLRVALIGDSITGQSVYRSSISAMTAAAGVATVTSTAHNVFPGQVVHISNADQDVFNGFKTVLARNSSSEFTFAIDANAPAAATGTNMGVLNQIRFQDRAPFEQANAGLGHPFYQVGCAGFSGAKLTAIASRFDSDVAPLAPNIVVLQGGINDALGAGVGDEAAALAAMQSAMLEMIEKTFAIGAIPIVETAGPLSSTATGYSAARGQVVLAFNHWLRDLAAYRYPRMILADSWATLVDPTSATGDFATDLSVDGIHRTALGSQRVAARFRSLLTSFAVNPIPRVASVLDRFDSDASNRQIYPNPLMQGTGGTKSVAGAGTGTNTGDVPDGITVLWTRAGTGTVVNSIVSRADGIGSDHQLVVVSANASDAVQVDLTSSIHARVQSGDTLVCEVHLVVTGITAMSALQFGCLLSYDGTAYTTPLAISSGTVGALADDIDMVLRTPPITIGSASVTNFEPRLTATFSGAGGATIKIGRLSVHRMAAPPA